MFLGNISFFVSLWSNTQHKIITLAASRYTVLWDSCYCIVITAFSRTFSCFWEGFLKLQKNTIEDAVAFLQIRDDGDLS